MVKLENITKRYGDFVAVNKLNLQINRGELFGFLGPNGAGKTTTIKMAVGLLKPTEGAIYISGRNIQQDPIKAKEITGYLPENPFLYGKLTGKEYLQFVANLYGVEKEEQKNRIEELLHLFDLEKAQNKLIETFSRGMCQKLALTGILVHKPRVIFLDEPTNGLDPQSAKLTKDILRQFCMDGTTIIMSTHILEIAERLCDRIGIINNGNLIATGTLKELQNIAKKDKSRLEDIFLELTGGSKYNGLISFL